uniref:CS domain-containing protein n=1 Tax=Fibrocapsa japonica TaxID=94617 RepID=A0A7S2Y2M6_9STRA|mmetsp:Transcript_283/g.464  ORF Transcript_283/g.464 Transcript_283/m.464 type:complete len:240 (+) Transcript_283:82-801(+)
MDQTEIQQDIAELKELFTKLRPGNVSRIKAMVNEMEASLDSSPDVPPPPPPSAPPAQNPVQLAPATPPATQQSVTYSTIATFGWDQGEYNSPWVFIYISLDGVGACKDRVACDFTKSSFDLKVIDLDGKNYRLLKDNLDKDIVPSESKCIVKKNRITIKLKKVKGEYSFDHWTDLVAKKKKSDSKKEDPSASIMDMMKDMYQDGDDNMKKIIGEAMMKAQRGEKSEPGMPDMDLPPMDV